MCYSIVVARAGKAAQWAECLPTMQELLGSIPALLKLGMVAHTCDLSMWKVEKDAAEVQGHPWLKSKFKARLGYIVACLKRGTGGG